jgi:hypothetical protein
MDNVLQTALAEAVNSLASFFGTTTEAVMEHAPEFLTKYGWYSTLSNLPEDIFFTLLIIMMFCLLGSLVIFGLDLDLDLKNPAKAIIGFAIVCLVISIGTKIITCAVAPEIVGAHAILDLLKSVK